MKYFLLIIIFISPSTLAEGNKLLLAKELLVVMNMDAQIEAMGSTIRDMQSRQLQQYDIPAEAQHEIENHLNGTMKLIFSTFKKPSVKDKYAQLYADAFSEAELKGILEFYKTGAGKSFLEKFPSVMTGISRIAEEQLASIHPQLKQLDVEFQKKLEMYK